MVKPDELRRALLVKTDALRRALLFCAVLLEETGEAGTADSAKLLRDFAGANNDTIIGDVVETMTSISNLAIGHGATIAADACALAVERMGCRIYEGEMANIGHMLWLAAKLRAGVWMEYL